MYYLIKFEKNNWQVLHKNGKFTKTITYNSVLFRSLDKCLSYAAPRDLLVMNHLKQLV